MPDSSGSIDLGNLSKDEQEAVEKLAEAADTIPEDKPKVLTAFSVIVGYDGNPEVVQYVGDDLLLQSNPTSDLVKGACSNIVDDMQTMATAQAAAQMTAQYMMQQAQAMARQQQEAMLHQQVSKGLRV